MRFVLHIDMDKSPHMQTPNDVARALRRAASRIEAHTTFELIPMPASVIDSNKVSVGRWWIQTKA